MPDGALSFGRRVRNPKSATGKPTREATSGHSARDSQRKKNRTAEVLGDTICKTTNAASSLTVARVRMREARRDLLAYPIRSKVTSAWTGKQQKTASREGFLG